MDRKLDCLFVNPNSSRSIYQGLADRYSAIETPTWALLLAQSCRASGYGVAILDANAERLTDTESVQRIKDADPRLVVLVGYGSEPNQGTAKMDGVASLCKLLKESYAEYKTCVVGSHASALPVETLALPGVDFVLLNEGVIALNNLLRTNLIDVLSIKGIGWKPWGGTDSSIRFTNDPEHAVFQPHMDNDLPGYAFDLLPKREKPIDLYRSHFWHADFSHELRTPSAAIYSSLGCPMKCSFCMINLVNRVNNAEGTTAADSASFRFWSPEHTFKQIEWLADNGVNTIRISDEMFFLQRHHYAPLLKLIKDKYRDLLRMWAYARVDTVRRHDLKLFRDAGIRWLCLGIESSDQKVRHEVQKGGYIEVNIREVVRQIRDAGINVIANYVFGLPDDTLETMEGTLNLAMEMNTEMANFYPVQALPGSPLHQEAKQKGWKLPDNFSGYGFLSYDSWPLPTNYLTAEEVLRFRDNAFHRYFGRPEYHKLIDTRFGSQAAANVDEWSAIKLKRKLLGDPPPEITG